MIEQILQADRYLQVDQVEKARDVYQKVVDMDPGNAIAVVGLARCALFDGDDQAAYELASRALEIDPENDMARRMEARLSEILATRGEPVVRPEAAATPAPEEMRPVVTEEPRPGRAAAAAAPSSTATPTEPTRGAAESARTTDRPSPTPAPTPSVSTRPTPPFPPAPPPAKAKEPAVRKSLFDRLMGR